MNHHFNTEIAKQYGLEEAILLENLYFWVKKNKANNQNYHNGYYWTYNSVKAFNELFDYITPSKISRALKNLEVNGLVKSGCFNTNKYDHTKWYTVTEKAKAFFENDVSILQNEKSKEEIEKSTCTESEITITDINTNDKTLMINTDKATSDEVPPAPKKQKHIFGEYKKVKLTDDEFEKLKTDYGEQRTLQAIQYLDEYKEMKGKKYQSDYLALRKWVFKALDEKDKPYSQKGAYDHIQSEREWHEKLDNMTPEEIDNLF